MSDTLRQCRIVRLAGYVPYAEAYELQTRARDARLSGCIDDTVYLLEHTPTITIGRSAVGEANLLTAISQLSARGITVVQADRGGDVTYHAPGQLVGYPILDLTNHGRDLHLYLRELEQALIDTLATYHLTGDIVAGLTGVWVGGRKIAAIGIKATRWVTMHGFALNIDLDLTPMRRDIVACGIKDRDVTSLAEAGVQASRSDVEARFTACFAERFGVDPLVSQSTASEETAWLNARVDRFFCKVDA